MEITPEGIQNQEAYQDYLEMKNAYEKSEEKVYKTSIEGLYIDFAAPASTIRKLYKDLPLKEKEFIDNMSHKFSVLKGLITLKKKESFVPVDKKNSGDIKDVLQIRQAEILELFGRFFKVSEVIKIIQSDWGYQVTRHRLETFVKANAEKIKSLQDEHQKSPADLRLYHKRSRLEELSFLYNNLKQQYEENGIREDAKLMKEILESIKKECEGDLVVNINGKIEIEQTIALQVQNEIMKEFNITALVINKMAGKLGVNPHFIQARLMNSHYAKFTGFRKLGPGENMYEDEIFSPSGITYNLDDIENKNLEVTREEDKKKALPIISEQEEPQVNSIRDILKKKLLAEQENVQKSKMNVIKNE